MRDGTGEAASANKKFQKKLGHHQQPVGATVTTQSNLPVLDARQL